MKIRRRIGILTSGGDCPGLNAAIRGVAKAAYEMFEQTEIIGIADGYAGLISGEGMLMRQSDFSGILTRGGTILGTSRQNYREICEAGEGKEDKVAAMKKNYRAMKLDCLVILGGNGTYKTANRLSSEGLNVITLPKTIDNDVCETDVTFGFHTAVETAAGLIDRIRTTADSHGRVMVVELMGNKAGWLTLYAAMSGGADVALIPELPYSMDSVLQRIERRMRGSKRFSIVAVAEGALSKSEVHMKKKERAEKFAMNPYRTAAHRVAEQIHKKTGLETRAVVPGHILRGGSPCAYDRVLSTRFGVYAAQLIHDGCFGSSVALVCDQITHAQLKDVAGRTKFVPTTHQIIADARRIGICFGDGE